MHKPFRTTPVFSKNYFVPHRREKIAFVSQKYLRFMSKPFLPPTILNVQTPEPNNACNVSSARTRVIRHAFFTLNLTLDKSEEGVSCRHQHLWDVSFRLVEKNVVECSHAVRVPVTIGCVSTLDFWILQLHVGVSSEGERRFLILFHLGGQCWGDRESCFWRPLAAMFAAMLAALLAARAR